MGSQFFVQSLEVHYKLTKDWLRPYFLGSRLRGMFGHALNSLSCQIKNKSDVCKHNGVCAYHTVFSPIEEQGRSFPSLFVIQSPELGEKKLKAGDILSFKVLLFGQAILWLVPVLQAWANANFDSDNGAIRFLRIDLLDNNNDVVNYWCLGDDFPLAVPFSPVFINKTPESLTLNFLTPLHLRQKSQDIKPKQLEAEHIVLGALRRMRLMDPDWQLHYPDLILPKEAVKAWAKSLVIEKDLKWQSLKRWSNSQKQEIPISGMLGQVQLYGNLEPFTTALQLLPYVGLGKNCNLGLGQVEIVN